MEKNISVVLQNIQKNQAVIELKSCNDLTKKYGLVLCDEDISELIENRFKALKSTGRIEFQNGILKALVEAFCDSPYIMQQNYKDTLLELQDCFYYFKNEAMDQIADDELIEFMKTYFDEQCQGSIEYLTDITLGELCRNTRYGLNRKNENI